MGVNWTTLDAVPHGEHKEEFAESNNDTWDQGWTTPMRFSSHGAWINQTVLNDADWIIETVAVRVKHWPDQMPKCSADNFAKSNKATFIHWVKRHSPAVLCRDKGWHNGARWMSLANMTEEDLKQLDQHNASG